MRTRLLIIAGIAVTLATVFFVLGPSQGHVAQYFLNDEQFEEMILNNDNEDRYSAHDESFADESKVTGNMAQEICSITGGECPPNYFANILDDGSKMVGITISDTVIEKQFVFIIENNTLSYTKTIYENGNRRLDCNTPDDPHKEYQCFKNAFSNCQLAKVDPDQYTIEGSPIFTNVTITSDCKIYGIIDTTTDVHGDRGIIMSTCETLTDDQYGWDIKDCDALNYPEMHFNYEMQLYPQIMECEENGNTWVRENLECIEN